MNPTYLLPSLNNEQLVTGPPTLEPASPWKQTRVAGPQRFCRSRLVAVGVGSCRREGLPGAPGGPRPRPRPPRGFFCLGPCLLQLSGTTVSKVCLQPLLPQADLVSWILLREFGLLMTLKNY